MNTNRKRERREEKRKENEENLVSVQDKRRSSIEITHAQTNIEYTTKKKEKQSRTETDSSSLLRWIFIPKTRIILPTCICACACL